MPPRIYLDNAATSWPKPESVYLAMDRYLRENGAPAGRGGYGHAVEVERTVADCRRRIAQMINARDPHEIIFTANCTDSLNMALHGCLNEGDHVVTTVCEHNSVLRPLRQLESAGRITVDRIDCDSVGNLDPEQVRRAITNETHLIAMIHSSNVTGTVLPVEQVGGIAADHGVPLLVDAAQSIGVLPIDVQRQNVSFLAAPGHKHLFGPLGIGFLYVASECADQLRTTRQGGTGTSSDEDRQPETLPEKFESGNLNVPAILGLRAGLEYLAEHTVEAVHEKTSRLTAQAIEGLREISGVRLYGPCGAADATARGGVVSFNIEGYDSGELVALLDASFGIQVRGGFHCAPLMHAALQTGADGAVRASPGWFNDESDIDQLIQAVTELAADDMSG